MTKFNKRRWLEQKFSSLHVGELEDMDKLSEDELEAMIDELNKAQETGELNLETIAGVDKLQEIVDSYI
jgi:hypothetical protein